MHLRQRARALAAALLVVGACGAVSAMMSAGGAWADAVTYTTTEASSHPCANACADAAPDDPCRNGGGYPDAGAGRTTGQRRRYGHAAVCR